MAEPLDTTDSTEPVITLEPVNPERGGPRRSAFNLLGGDKKQSTTNTNIADSYNSTESNVSTNTVGDSSLSIGNTGGSSETVAIVVGAIALLGGLYLFTR